MRREIVGIVAVVAAGLLGSSGPGTGAAAAQGASPCPAGQENVTIKFAKAANGRCAVEGSVPKACVNRGRSIRWTLENKDCVLDSKKNAVEMSAARLKTDTTKTFAWGCTPKKNGWGKGKKEILVCRVPEGADEGTYKYDVEGQQVDKLDPDVEVRKGN